MRVLFYGGCHAAAMRRIADRYARPGTEAEHLTNFVLIERGTPFPLEILERFDAVVFSPILNRGAWNTAHLEDACAARGVRAVKVPWLEWHGYFTESTKVDHGWYTAWENEALAAEARRHERFEDFFDAVVHGDALAAEALAGFESTTARLRELEQASAVDIEVSGFILDTFRRRRLFLTPDHAATPLYQYVMQRLDEILDLGIDPSFYHSAVEVQQGYQTPILPSVARALGLEFAGADYEHQEFARDHVISLRDHLASVFRPEQVLRLRALRATRLRLPGPDGRPGDSVEVTAGTRLVARRADTAPGGYDRVTVVAQPGTPRTKRGLIRRSVLVYRPHWAATSLVRERPAAGYLHQDEQPAPRYPVDPSTFAAGRGSR